MKFLILSFALLTNPVHANCVHSINKYLASPYTGEFITAKQHILSEDRHVIEYVFYNVTVTFENRNDRCIVREYTI